MTHEERADRRKKMATRAQEVTVAEVAQEFGVRFATVRDACREHGVTPVSEDRRMLSSYQLVADLCNTDESLGSLGRKHCVTTQMVHKVYKKCKEAGVPVRTRAQTGSSTK